MRIADLVGHDLVLEPKGTAFRDELDQAAAAAGVQLGTLAEVDGMTLVASLAFGGFGPAILPTTATLDQRAGHWTRDPGRRPPPPGGGPGPPALGPARRAGPGAARGRRLELVAETGPRHQGVEVDFTA